MNPIRRVNNRLKLTLIDLGILRARQQTGSVIVMYHGVDRVENRTFNPRFFSAENFERHLVFFKSHFDVVPLASIFRDPPTPGRFTLAVTFDDGYRNNYRYAFPLLEEHQVPATFLTTADFETENHILWPDALDLACVLGDPVVVLNGSRYQLRSAPDRAALNRDIKTDSRGRLAKADLVQQLLAQVGDFRARDDLRDYWELMHPDDIRAIARSSVVRIGSHGMHHNNLGELPLAEATDEVRRSKAALEALTNYEVDAISYPDGSYTRALVDAVEGLGFRYQLAVGYHFPAADGPDPRIRPRIGLYPPSTLNFVDFAIRSWA